VGMALLPDFIDFVPGLQSYCIGNALDKLVVRPKANSTKLWAKNFSPHMPGESIQVPASWSDFITLLLLNPKRFEWANSLLRSKAQEMIITETQNEITIEYSLNAKCPVSKAIHCNNAQLDDQSETMFSQNVIQIEAPHGSTPTKEFVQEKVSVSTSALHLKRKRAKAPMVVLEVSRSERLKGKT
jgi:hypothetical protein